MRTFAIVTILFAMLVGFTAGGHRTRPDGRTLAPVQPLPQPAPPVATPGTIAIGRNGDGHFMVAGTANGAALDFVVDTGASKVALSRDDARRAGIYVSDSDFVGRAQTATAAIRVAYRTLPRLRVGSIELHDVPVLILDVPQAAPLLGQSFLARLDRVSIEGDRMTLTKL